jgi:hypothetical protein
MQCKKYNSLFCTVLYSFLRAIEAGACGAPSFQIDDGPIVFGQDHLNVVEDMLLGWEFNLYEHLTKTSKL